MLCYLLTYLLKARFLLTPDYFTYQRLPINQPLSNRMQPYNCISHILFLPKKRFQSSLATPTTNNSEDTIVISGGGGGTVKQPLICFCSRGIPCGDVTHALERVATPLYTCASVRSRFNYIRMTPPRCAQNSSPQFLLPIPPSHSTPAITPFPVINTRCLRHLTRPKHD